MSGPEARIRQRYRTLAQQHGWLTLTLHGSGYSGPGRSDTFTIAHGVPIAVEFKTAVGTPTPMQVRFIREMRAAGGYGFLARVATEARDGVLAILTGTRPYHEEEIELDLSILDRALAGSNVQVAPPASLPDLPPVEVEEPSNIPVAASPAFAAAIDKLEEPPNAPVEKEPRRTRRGRPVNSAKSVNEAVDALKSEAETPAPDPRFPLAGVTAPVVDGREMDFSRGGQQAWEPTDHVKDDGWTAAMAMTELATRYTQAVEANTKALQEVIHELSGVRSEMAALTDMLALIRGAGGESA